MHCHEKNCYHCRIHNAGPFWKPVNQKERNELQHKQLRWRERPSPTSQRQLDIELQIFWRATHTRQTHANLGMFPNVPSDVQTLLSREISQNRHRKTRQNVFHFPGKFTLTWRCIKTNARWWAWQEFHHWDWSALSTTSHTKYIAVMLTDEDTISSGSKGVLHNFSFSCGVLTNVVSSKALLKKESAFLLFFSSSNTQPDLYLPQRKTVSCELIASFLYIISFRISCNNSKWSSVLFTMNIWSILYETSLVSPST